MCVCSSLNREFIEADCLEYLFLWRYMYVWRVTLIFAGKEKGFF